jgi:hypothetical protein
MLMHNGGVDEVLIIYSQGLTHDKFDLKQDREGS